MNTNYLQYQVNALRSKRSTTESIFKCLMLFCLLMGFSVGVLAQKVPKWEAGIGALPIYIPHYRGSNSAHKYVVPYPVYRFRGEKYSANNEEGLKRWLFVGDRVHLNLSLMFGIPVNERSTQAGRAVDGLPSTFEFGPRATMKLIDSKKHIVAIKAPLRVGFGVDFDGVYYQGWVTAPFLQYSYRTWGRNSWKLGLATGVRYSNQSYQNYYYSVSAGPEGQLAYQAPGGYGGWWNSIAIYRRLGTFELSFYGRYDFLEGASFENSPLVETKRYPAAGMAIVWWFARSHQSVEIDARDRY